MRYNSMECEECQQWREYRECCNNVYCDVGKRNMRLGKVTRPDGMTKAEAEMVDNWKDPKAPF